MSINVKCDECSKVFQVYPSRFKSRKNFFCSKKCEGKFRSKLCTSKVECICSVCGKKIKIKKSQYKRRNKNSNITCSIKCLSEIKKKIYAGRNNPNCKYDKLDDNFFSEIDSPEKAYILGWIASDGHVGKNGSITIQIHEKDKKILFDMRDLVCKQIPIVEYKKKNQCSLTFNSKKMSIDICRWLCMATPGKKSKTVQFPNLKNDLLTWNFLRGLFDGDGCIANPKINKKRVYPACSIASISSPMKKGIQKFCNTYCRIGKNAMWWSGKNSVKFLNGLYSNSNIHLERKYKLYLHWKTYYLTR